MNFPGIVFFASIDGLFEVVAFCCAYNHHEQKIAHAITGTRSMVLEKGGRENFTQMDR